jgi:hypothetical protein
MNMQKESLMDVVQGKAVRALPRIWRSPYSDFNSDGPDWQDETVTANQVYTDEVLMSIAESGFNAIWVHGQLHHLVPSSQFCEFGQHSAIHLTQMRALIERASRFGIGVYIYMQPPRGLPQSDPFWQAHPEIAGTPMLWQTAHDKTETYLSMCTSTSQVQDHLREASALLIRELAGLAGLILITASEYPSHCYRPQPVQCPRCEQRTAMDVITEIIRLVQDGVRSESPTVDVIVWNWSWSYVEADPSPGILKKLPEDIVLMADFERGDSKEILGQVRPIDEYSLSFAGPSQRFMSCYQEAQKRDIPILAKLQFGTTHELATVPNLPLLGNLYEKARQMRELRVTGFMGCWNFGNMTSANTVAFNTFFNAPDLQPRDAALELFASKYFPGCDAAGARQAWEIFARAMDNYPFSLPFIYYGPVNYSLAYPLKAEPLNDIASGRSWMNDVRGDRLDDCLKPYTLDEVTQGMHEVARIWKGGAELLENALREVDHTHAREEIATGWVCYHIWRSTWNTFRVYALRQDWNDSKREAYLKIAQDEVENLKQVLPYVEADRRFGYHSEAHAYLYDANAIREKIGSLEQQLRDLPLSN